MVAGNLFEKSTQDPTFLTKIVTGDESWVFAYDPETKMQSAEWHTSSSPRPKKSRLVKSKEKVMRFAFSDIDGVVHHDFVRLDRLLMVISTCKFCRGSAMQFGGNGAAIGRESGFCITITHRLLCSNSSPRKAFLSSPNHRTLRISLRVTFGCSLLRKWASKGRVSQPWRISNRMRRPNS